LQLGTDFSTITKSAAETFANDYAARMRFTNCQTTSTTLANGNIQVTLACDDKKKTTLTFKPSPSRRQASDAPAAGATVEIVGEEYSPENYLDLNDFVGEINSQPTVVIGGLPVLSATALPPLEATPAPVPTPAPVRPGATPAPVTVPPARATPAPEDSDSTIPPREDVVDVTPPTVTFDPMPAVTPPPPTPPPRPPYTPPPQPVASPSTGIPVPAGGSVPSGPSSPTTSPPRAPVGPIVPSGPSGKSGATAASASIVASLIAAVAVAVANI